MCEISCMYCTYFTAFSSTSMTCAGTRSTFTFYGKEKLLPVNRVWNSAHMYKHEMEKTGRNAGFQIPRPASTIHMVSLCRCLQPATLIIFFTHMCRQ